MSYTCEDCGYLSLGSDDHHNCLTVLKDEVERLKLFECENHGGYLLWDDKKWWASHLLTKAEAEVKRLQPMEKALEACEDFLADCFVLGLRDPMRAAHLKIEIQKARDL